MGRTSRTSSKRIIALHDASNIAVIVEPSPDPRVVPPKAIFERLRQICDKHGLRFIFDEVITGFGAMGQACCHGTFGVVPDMITFAKGVTNATIPLPVSSHVPKSSRRRRQ